MSGLRQRNRRGAVRRASRRPLWPLLRQGWLAAMGRLPLALLACAGIAAATGLWHGVEYLQQQPVSRVLFTGELEHVDREELVSEVAPLLVDTGFLTVSLERIRESLQALPWVDEASVTRQWPDELVVHITEQRAIATWGDGALLNHRGEIFRPRQRGDVSGLPRLGGPDVQAGEVVERFGALGVLLAEHTLRLARLDTDERGSWTAELEGGVVLNLGRGDVMKKMQRFLRAYQVALNREFDRVAYVDLRHDNGLAVGWKAAASAQAGVSKRSGGLG